MQFQLAKFLLLFLQIHQALEHTHHIGFGDALIWFGASTAADTRPPGSAQGSLVRAAVSQLAAIRRGWPAWRVAATP